MVQINPNIINLKESATLKINQLVKKKRAEGETVYHYGFGQSPFPVHESMINKLKENAYHKDYLPTLGLLELRQNISSYYKKHFDYDLDPEHIAVCPGSKELLFQVLYSLEGKVLVPAPSWVSYGPQVHIKGRQFIDIQTSIDNSYKLQARELEEACKKLDPMEQKVLIINSPNNPTGALYNEEEIKGICEVAKKNNIIILSDEIYAQVDFTFKKKKGFLHFYPEGVVLFSGISKAQSAGGYRMGFMATSKELNPLVRAIASLISETYSAVSAPIQYAALEAYSENKKLDDYIDQCTRIHKACGEYMAKRFNKMNAACPSPEGAFYLMPSFDSYKDKLASHGVHTSINFTTFCLQKANVAMLPGSDFYMPEESLTCRVAHVDYDGDKVYQASLNVQTLDDSFVEKYCPQLKDGLDKLESLLINL